MTRDDMTQMLSPDRQAAIPTVLDREPARIRCYLLVASVDLTVLTVSFLIANRIHLGATGGDHGLALLLMLLPIYLVVAAMNRALSGRVLEDARDGAIRSLQSFVLAVAAILLIVYALKSGDEFSRVVFALGSLGAILLLPLSRLALAGPVRSILGGTPYSTVVVRDDVQWNARPGDIVVTPEQLQFDPETSDPLRYHVLAHTIAHADRVIVACSNDRCAMWARVLKGMAVNGELVSPDNDRLGIIGIGQHHGHQTLVVSAGPLHLRDRIMKRGLDLSIALLALLMLSPVLIATAILIRAESRGSVLFAQDRIGRDNKIFRMFKFRSMFSDRCDRDAAALTTRQDARVTRVGAFIRRNSIDELPQLLNVVLGQMSIVGPRPHALAAKAADLLYWDVDPRYRHRHLVKPGMTGLAQIRGFRGATDRTEDLTQRLNADLEYVSRWSIAQDLAIVARTLGVLRHDNAF